MCESQRILRDPVLESDALPLCSVEYGKRFHIVSDFASVRTVREPSRIRECAFVHRCDMNTYTKPYNTQIIAYHYDRLVFLLRDVS